MPFILYYSPIYFSLSSFSRPYSFSHASTTVLCTSGVLGGPKICAPRRVVRLVRTDISPPKILHHLFISLTPKLWSCFPSLISLKYLHFIRLFWFSAVAIDWPSLYMWFDTKLSAFLQCCSPCGSRIDHRAESLTSNVGTSRVIWVVQWAVASLL